MSIEEIRAIAAMAVRSGKLKLGTHNPRAFEDFRDANRRAKHAELAANGLRWDGKKRTRKAFEKARFVDRGA